jgi:hypothetical protein
MREPGGEEEEALPDPADPANTADPADPADSEREAFSRRDLLAGAAAAGLAFAAWPATAQGIAPGIAPGAAPGAEAGAGETAAGFEVRVQAARLERDMPAVRHAANGDEQELPRYIACFSKALPHNALGEVDAGAYGLLLKALASRRPRDFELIPIGGRVKLANPQSAFAANLIGPAPGALALAAAPRFASAEQAGELVELYWQALARDVPFDAYDTDPVAAQAAADLSRLSAFRGPRAGGKVTPRTLFRGNTPGDLDGPYVSQFLWRDIAFTPIRVEQKIRTAVPALDYMTSFDDWLRIQNGAIAPTPNQFLPQARYIRSGRDLGEYVHREFTYQAPLGAALILLKMGALANAGNPYKYSRTQSPFTTFGAPYLLYLLAIVTQVALTACWYQKWMVHRRLRPEELGGRVENHRRHRAAAPLHEELIASAALAETERRQGNALLAQAYPEGAPAHPSYPAGHAVIAGAGATVLKAFFDESFVLPNPIVPSADGLSLVPYQGPPLTVGGELDKLAANVGRGRNFAGIHWRSDMAGGLRFGEELALCVLREMRLTGNEMFAGYHLRRFDGSRVTA